VRPGEISVGELSRRFRVYPRGTRTLKSRVLLRGGQAGRRLGAQ
jgi:hypothetical protein